MKPQPILLCLMVIAALGVTPSSAHASSQDYYNAVFQGDLSNIADNPGIPDNLMAQFDARFIDRTDGLDVSGVSDPLALFALDAFQNYWRDTLLHPEDRAEQERAL